MKSFDEAILKILEEVFNTRVVSNISKFRKGLSNDVYKFKVNEKKYVISIPKKERNIALTNEKELELLKALEKEEITAKLIYYDIETGIRISSLIDEKKIYKKKFMNELVVASKKIHDFNFDLSKSDLIDKLNKCEKRVSNIDKKYYELKEVIFDKYMNKYKNDDVVLCHGDMQEDNIIFDGNSLKIIDWEYAITCSYYYDIASFGNTDFKESLSFLEKYNGKENDKEDIKKLAFYTIYQMLFWYLIAKSKSHFVKDKFDKIAFNYIEVARKKITLLKEE